MSRDLLLTLDAKDFLVAAELARKEAGKLDTSIEKVGTQGAPKAQKGLGGFLERVKGAGAGVAAIVGSVAIGESALVRIGGSAIRAGAELVALGADAEEAAGKFSTVFGPNTEAMTEFINEWGRAAGLARTEGQSLLADLGVLGEGFGLVSAQLPVFSQGLARAAADMQSMHNSDITDVLADIKSGLVGSSEPLLKYGINLMAANVNTKALAMTGKESAKSLTDQEKIAARYTLILEGLNAAQGDLERTQDSTSNRLKRVGALWEDIKTKAGSLLTAAVRPMIAGFSDIASRYGPVLISTMEKITAVFSGEGAGGALGTFVDRVKHAWEMMKAWYGFLGGVFIGAWKGVWDILKAVVGAVMDLAGAFVPAINTTEGASGVLEGFQSVLTVVGNTIQSVITIVVGLVEAFASVAGVVGKALRGDFKGAAEEAKGAWESLKALPTEIAAVWTDAGEEMVDVKDDAVDPLKWSIDDFKISADAGAGAADGLGESLGGSTPKAGALKEELDGIQAGLVGLPFLSGNAAAAVRRLADVRMTELAVEFGILTGRVEEEFKPALLEVPEVVLPKVEAESRSVFQALGGYVSDAASGIGSAFGAILQSFKDNFTAGGGILGIAKNLFGGGSGGILGIAQGLVPGISGIFGAIKGAVSGDFGAILDVAKGILPAPGGAIIGMVESLAPAVGKAFEGIADAIGLSGESAADRWKRQMEEAGLTVSETLYNTIKEISERTAEEVERQLEEHHQRLAEFRRRNGIVPPPANDGSGSGAGDPTNEAGVPGGDLPPPSGGPPAAPGPGGANTPPEILPSGDPTAPGPGYRPQPATEVGAQQLQAARAAGIGPES